VLIRVNSWIVVFAESKTIHEFTLRITKGYEPKV